MATFIVPPFLRLIILKKGKYFYSIMLLLLLRLDKKGIFFRFTGNERCANINNKKTNASEYS
jgi:hypothetical protein